MSVPKATQKLLDLIIAKAQSSFCGSLRCTHKTKIISSDKTDGTTFLYQLTPRVCKAKAGKMYLPIGSCMAIFDELSTWGFMISDMTHRGGVSIHLNAELLNNTFDINETTDVLITTKASKVGKTIGFCDMTITSNDGKTVIAKGSHIKFLPMGFIWDFLMQPNLLPITLSCVEVIAPVLGYFVPMFKLPSIDGPMKQHSKELGAIYTELEVTSTADNTSTMIVTKSKHNPLGSLHGGCVAMACEEAAIFKYPELKGSHMIRSMEVRYLSSMQDVVCLVSNAQTTDKGNIITIGKVMNKKNSLCAQFTCSS